MAAPSPVTATVGVVKIVIRSNGAALPHNHALISLTVGKGVNRLSHARLVLRDGDVGKQTFELSDSDTLAPGAAIEIEAGYGDTCTLVFAGVVVRHGIHIHDDKGSELVVECRHAAFPLTLARSSNDGATTDGDAIRAILAAANLAAEVDATEASCDNLVQYRGSDWDFVLARAAANGLLVITGDQGVTVKAPAMDAEPVLCVTYGVDLISFEGETDARTQFADAGSIGRDKATQQTAAPLTRARGRLRFCGSALAVPGATMTLAGLGKRFSGNVFIGAVEHAMANGDWRTDVEFGLAPEWAAPPGQCSGGDTAPGLLPGGSGLHIGVVNKLDEDPAGQHRVQVTMAVSQNMTQRVWARLASAYGSDAAGAFFIPEIGDEVIVGHVNNDPCKPVVLGSLYSSRRAPPYPLTANNDIKAIVTRGLLKVEFDDDKRVLTLHTPAGNTVVLSDEARSIVMSDQHGNKAALDDKGIMLDSPHDVVLKAGGRITLNAGANIEATAAADLQQSAVNIRSQASMSLVAKGAASAELSASGQVTVKGAMVAIN